MRWVGDGQPLSRAECERWIDVTFRNYARYGYGMFAAELLETGDVAGFCGIVHPGGQPEPEVKYAFRREHWGKGLATEAVHGLLHYAFARLRLPAVIATVDPEHAASQRVLTKGGMSQLETRIDPDGSPVLVFGASRAGGC